MVQKNLRYQCCLAMFATMETSDLNSLRDILRLELVERCRRNRNYSLRSFAKNLKMSHGALSEILSGKRKITQKAVVRICDILDLDPQQVVQADKINGAFSRTPFSIRPPEIIAIMSEWYFDAILELARVKSFKPKSPWIAKKLGITVSQANIALDILFQYGILEKKGNKVLCHMENSTSVEDDKSSLRTRLQVQRQLLEKSIEALERVERKKRDHSSLTVAIRKKDLEEIRKKIKRFRRDLNAFAQKDSKNLDTLYQLTVSFFPLEVDV